MGAPFPATLFLLGRKVPKEKGRRSPMPIYANWRTIFTGEKRGVKWRPIEMEPLRLEGGAPAAAVYIDEDWVCEGVREDSLIVKRDSV